MKDKKETTFALNPAPEVPTMVAEDIDKIIHEPGRLMILLHLYVVVSADFIYLMRQTGLSKGNLSSHLSKLEEAGYVMIMKEFIDKKPHTLISLTEAGRTAFESYKERIKELLK
jgi:DNA-binding MarR family transcriptional regulator